MKVLYISQQSERGSVCAIGLAKEGYSTTQLPGWSAYSFGWHSDDGAKFHNSGKSVGTVEPFRENDTVGMGILFSTREIFGLFLCLYHIPNLTNLLLPSHKKR